MLLEQIIVEVWCVQSMNFVQIEATFHPTQRDFMQLDLEWYKPLKHCFNSN